MCWSQMKVHHMRSLSFEVSSEYARVPLWWQQTACQVVCFFVCLFFPRKCLFLICHVSPLTEWTGFSQMIPLISCLAYACQRQWGNCDKDVFEHFILRVRAIVKCYNVSSTSYGRYQHIKRHHCWPCCFPCFSFYILLYAYTTMSNGVPRAL